MTTPRRRLIVIDPSTAPTGALRAATNLVVAASSWGETVLVLSERAQVTPADVEAFDRTVRVPMRQIRRAWTDIALYGPALIAAVWRIRKMLTPDTVVVLNDFYLLHGGLLRLLKFRGPVIVWVRADPLAFPSLLRQLWLAVTRTASTRIVAVSDFIAGRLAEAGIACERIYDPVDPRRARPDASVTRSRTIVQIANYTRGKGQDDAIAAFLPVAARDPTVRLLFHGGDMGLERNRQYRAELQASAAASGYGDRILFRDFAERVEDVLAESAFALVLSHRESFSLACLEACQNGRAVIAYRSGGPEEIVEDGATGVLCDVGDIAAVTAAMTRLLADPVKADALGIAGAALVAQRFAPESFKAKIRTLLFSATDAAGA